MAGIVDGVTALSILARVAEAAGVRHILGWEYVPMDGEPNDEDIEAEAEVVEAELRGAAAGIIGRIKHALGAVTGQDQLKRSGQAQQEQARATLDFAEQPAAARDDTDAPGE